MSGAHTSHAEATRLWMLMAAGGNDAKGQGRVCADCQFPDRTISCRNHFAAVARGLVRLRLEASKPTFTEKTRAATAIAA